MTHPDTADVRVLLFGALRDRAGTGEVAVATSGGTVLDVWRAAVTVNPRIDGDLDSIRCARNLEYCGWHDEVKPGDEVAFMPPVAGGRATDDGLTVTITSDPIALDELLARAGGQGDGAIACFGGRVRDSANGVSVRALDYEAYVPMALAVMRRIAEEAKSRRELSSVAIIHRVGRLSVGDLAVAVVTASVHRAAALLACSEIIDAVKADVPIWKCEHTTGGAVWVDGRGARDACLA